MSHRGTCVGCLTWVSSKASLRNVFCTIYAGHHSQHPGQDRPGTDTALTPFWKGTGHREDGSLPSSPRDHGLATKKDWVASAKKCPELFNISHDFNSLLEARGREDPVPNCSPAFASMVTGYKWDEPKTQPQAHGDWGNSILQMPPLETRILWGGVRWGGSAHPREL